jgi:hypothetical protein
MLSSARPTRPDGSPTCCDFAGAPCQGTELTPSWILTFPDGTTLNLVSPGTGQPYSGDFFYEGALSGAAAYPVTAPCQGLTNSVTQVAISIPGMAIIHLSLAYTQGPTRGYWDAPADAAAYPGERFRLDSP